MGELTSYILSHFSKLLGFFFNHERLIICLTITPTPGISLCAALFQRATGGGGWIPFRWVLVTWPESSENLDRWVSPIFPEHFEWGVFPYKRFCSSHQTSVPEPEVDL